VKANEETGAGVETGSYFDKYESIKMRRERGILELTFHSDGDSLSWAHGSSSPQEQFASAFTEIAMDPENQIVIMTGSGSSFSGPAGSSKTFAQSAPRDWDRIQRVARRIISSLLEIDALVISCVNGPALRHAEVPLLADIVLAAPEAVFQDSAHYPNRMTSGDGMQVVMPLLMGHNRARYFILTGEAIDANRAKELGLVNEIVPRDQLLSRAWQLADQLVEQNPMVIRYTRRLFTHPLKALMHQSLDLGLALEGLANTDESLLRAEAQAASTAASALTIEVAKS
jgi:enoyl-CoA hydratase/carnithine racemase